jgi:hypothetical protein
MVLAVLVCVTVAHAEPAFCQDKLVTPSEIAADPDKFDGKHVRVRGYVVITPHSRNIFDSKQGFKDPQGACLGLYGSKSFVLPARKRMEIVSGIYRKVLCGPNDICLYWCNSSGIEVDH